MFEDTGAGSPRSAAPFKRYTRPRLLWMYDRTAEPPAALAAPQLAARSEAGAAPRRTLPNPLRAAQPAAKMNIRMKAKDPTTGTS